jgi:glycosyltransferase involved in cell wall biosynthesis
MRVLFIGALPDPITGQSLACQVFLDELRKQHSVDVIDLSKREFKQGVNSLARVAEVFGVLWNVWRLRRSADIIYFTISESFAGNLKDICIYLLCHRQLSRMYVHLHGGAGLRGILLGPPGLIRRLNEFCLRRLGGVIVLGARHVDMFEPSVARSRIHIVPNFAQEYLFSSVAAIERKFADTQPLRVLFLSNLIPGKGYLELLDAFLSLPPEQQQRLSIDFAGGFESDDQQQVFLARIAGLPQIRYHGVVRGEKKLELFTRAHVFCLPTYYPYEGQPISILEAYAAGCAVVTTDHSGIFDVFTPGTNGYQVGKRSVADLARVFGALLADPAHLVSMALNNFLLAQREFMPDRYSRNLLAVLQSFEALPAHQTGATE